MGNLDGFEVGVKVGTDGFVVGVLVGTLDGDDVGSVGSVGAELALRIISKKTVILTIYYN